MAEWDPDLRRRQAAHDADDDDAARRSLLMGAVGESVDYGSVGGSVGAGRSRWRPLLVPLTVLMVGLLLAFVGPVPGLGVFLVLGAAIATPVVLLAVWLG